LDNRTLGILSTIATAVICGCVGLFSLIFGALGVLQVPFQTSANGVQSSTPLPSTVAYVLLCLAVVLFAIPVVVGFLTLRPRPAPPHLEGPIPPPS
jgi:hypothetical protein